MAQAPVTSSDSEWAKCSDSEDDKEDFVVVGDDGEVIDPAAEASCLMALHVFQDMEAKGLQFQDTTVSHTDITGAPNLLQEHEALIRDLLQTAEGADQDQHEDEGEGGDGEDADFEATDSSSLSRFAAEGMTRTWSDHAEDEEWILEEILARRKAKSLPEDTNPEDQYDYDEEYSKKSGAIKANKKADFGFEYLCRWKWYTEPTWEHQTLLENEGFGKQIQEFNDVKSGKLTSLSRPRGPRKALPAEVSLIMRVFGPMQQAALNHMSSCGVKPLAIVDVARPHLVRAFLGRWLHMRDTTPTMLFHGTRGCNVASIVDRGLLIPGSGGVRVLNGTAHGVGIYTATNASTSRGYTDPYCVMFICVGLLGPGCSVATAGDFRVFRTSELIVPLWLVHFQTAYSNEKAAPAEWTMSDLAAHLRGENAFAGAVRELEVQSEGVGKTLAAGAIPPDFSANTPGCAPARAHGDKPDVPLDGQTPARFAAGEAAKKEKLKLTSEGKVSKKMLKKGSRSLKQALRDLHHASKGSSQ
jgi:hypothetical protein